MKKTIIFNEKYLKLTIQIRNMHTQVRFTAQHRILTFIYDTFYVIAFTYITFQCPYFYFVIIIIKI